MTARQTTAKCPPVVTRIPPILWKGDHGAGFTVGLRLRREGGEPGLRDLEPGASGPVASSLTPPAALRSSVDLGLVDVEHGLAADTALDEGVERHGGVAP